jgi:uncharacterized protein
MDMQGSRQLSATQQQAWDALIDPQVLKQCIPGCDSIELTGENQYAIGMSVKIGPVSAKFAGKIALLEINAPHSYKIAFEGQGGAAGFGKGNSEVKLQALPAGCALNYTAHAQVGGKIAQVGQRLVDGVAKSMAEDFFKRFETVLQERHPYAVITPDSIASRADSVPATGQFGLKIPAWGWAAVIAVLAALVWKFC